jgi:hypothetical protein
MCIRYAKSAFSEEETDAPITHVVAELEDFKL